MNEIANFSPEQTWLTSSASSVKHKDVSYQAISIMAFGSQRLKVGRRNQYLMENNLYPNVVAVSNKSYPNQQF